jgi:hypothetical protein
MGPRATLHRTSPEQVYRLTDRPLKVVRLLDRLLMVRLPDRPLMPHLLDHLPDRPLRVVRLPDRPQNRKLKKASNKAFH